MTEGCAPRRLSVMDIDRNGTNGMTTNRISIGRWTLTGPLLMVALLLVCISFGMQSYRLISHHEHVFGLPMFNLDQEHNIPALFSTGLLLSASALLALIAMLARHNRTADVSKWSILAAGFLLMGMDESLSLHEHLIEPMRKLLGGRDLGVFYFAWVIPAIALVVALGVFFIPFMLRLPRRIGLGIAISAVVYLTGALGIELVEGWWREGHGHRNITYHLMVSVEEGMEMIGVIAFIHVLLGYVGARYQEIRIGFDAARAADAVEPASDQAQAAALIGSTAGLSTLD
jgi:hypothetical protein